jgi:hypothetical protein
MSGDIRPLPPDWQAYDADPEHAIAAIFGAIEGAIAHHPRSLQKRIGPSEVGMDCKRRLAYKLLDHPERDQQPNWKATIGTAVHAWLEQVFALPSDADPTETALHRWLTETTVDVGELPDGTHITGSCDCYDRVTGLVVDWKVVGPAQLKKYRANGPSQQYRTQAHLYGRGWVRAGLMATHVAIVFLPRNGDLRDAHVWHEPWNEEIATNALTVLGGIQALLAMQGDTALSLIPTADQYCFNCPFYRAGSSDLSAGCPGHQGATQNRAAQPALTLTK